MHLTVFMQHTAALSNTESEVCIHQPEATLAGSEYIHNHIILSFHNYRPIRDRHLIHVRESSATPVMSSSKVYLHSTRTGLT